VGPGFGLALATTPLSCFLASTERAGWGGRVEWLLGDVAEVSMSGALLVLAVVFAVGATLLALLRGAQTPGSAERLSPFAWLLFGLGLGIAGPVAFVGAIAAKLAGADSGLASERDRERPRAVVLVASGVAGAALVMLADALPRLALGGYAGPLTTMIVLVSFPALLLWHRAELRREGLKSGSVHRGVELVAIAATGLFLFALAYTVANYAALAT